jgi:trans-2,3-dihydro-3-hydroxyanthranilate isomerase
MTTPRERTMTAREELAAALGLDRGRRKLLDDVPAGRLDRRSAPPGAPRDRGVVDRSRPDAPRLAAALAQVGSQGRYLYSLDPVDPAAVAYARFFNPTVGIWEDPATGSAAGPLVSRLVARGVVRDGATVLVVQGHAMGRPSRIRVSGQQVRVGGAGVVVAEGTLHRLVGLLGRFDRKRHQAVIW